MAGRASGVADSLVLKGVPVTIHKARDAEARLADTPSPRVAPRRRERAGDSIDARRLNRHHPAGSDDHERMVHNIVVLHDQFSNDTDVVLAVMLDQKRPQPCPSKIPMVHGALRQSSPDFLPQHEAGGGSRFQIPISVYAVRRIACDGRGVSVTTHANAECSGMTRTNSLK